MRCYGSLTVVFANSIPRLAQAASGGFHKFLQAHPKNKFVCGKESYSCAPVEAARKWRRSTGAQRNAFDKDQAGISECSKICLLQPALRYLRPLIFATGASLRSDCFLSVAHGCVYPD